MMFEAVEDRHIAAGCAGTVLQVGGSAVLSQRLAGRYTGVRRCCLSDLDEALASRPDTVVTPWIDGASDCLDVAAALIAQDWDGTMLIAAPALPRPDIMLREIAAQAPLLEVAILPD